MTARATPSDLPRQSLLARLVHWLLLGWFRQSGWTVEGELPPDRKMVILGASHTSNWDFLVFLGVVDELGRHLRFVGKHTLFRWPMGDFMRALGGVPVNRDTSKDLVRQVVDQFALHDDFALVVAAEGTRSFTTRWRTGFYQIAMQAGVPIVCAGPDYPTKRGIIGPVIRPTGNYDEDMKPAFAFFRSLRPKHPERAGFPEGV